MYGKISIILSTKKKKIYSVFYCVPKKYMRRILKDISCSELRNRCSFSNNPMSFVIDRKFLSKKIDIFHQSKVKINIDKELNIETDYHEGIIKTNVWYY